MDRVPFVDQSGLYTLEDGILDLEIRGIEVVLVGLQEQPRDMLESVDLIPDLIPDHQVVNTVREAYAAAARIIKGEAAEEVTAG